MNLIPKFVTDTRQRIWLYVPKMAFLCICGSLPGSVIGVLILPHSPAVSFRRVSPLLDFVDLVLFSPISETLVLAGLSMLGRKFFKGDRTVALLSATFWAGIHASLFVRWGFAVFIPFFLMTLCYLAWLKVSFIKAFLVTASVHACINLIPTSFMLLHQQERPVQISEVNKQVEK